MIKLAEEFHIAVWSGNLVGGRPPGAEPETAPLVGA